MIEPGDKFTIGYGNDKTLEVSALSLRQKKHLMRKVDEMVKAQEDEKKALQLFDLIEDALVLAVGEEAANELVDVVDEEVAMDIATKVLHQQVLSEEDKKKSE